MFRKQLGQIYNIFERYIQITEGCQVHEWMRIYTGFKMIYDKQVCAT